LSRDFPGPVLLLDVSSTNPVAGGLFPQSAPSTRDDDGSLPLDADL
jgi:hypothetical protein